MPVTKILATRRSLNLFLYKLHKAAGRLPTSCSFIASRYMYAPLARNSHSPHLHYIEKMARGIDHEGLSFLRIVTTNNRQRQA